MNQRLDPRIAHTREVVLAATVAELTEVGFERISIDAIAERSGVARSTIYRNWTDRETLLAEAFRLVVGRGPADLADSGDLRQDLEHLGAMLAGQLTGENWERTVPSLISAAIHDDSMAQLLAGFADERAREVQAIVVRAEQRGEIASAADTEQIMERFVAPFFLRRLISARPLDQEFITSQVAATLDQLRAGRSLPSV